MITTKKTAFALLVCATLAFTESFAQIIHGIVKDETTGAGLAYVNIGIANKNIGVISRDDGAFSIDLSNANHDDRVTFSMVGYETRHIPLRELQKSNSEIRLARKTYELPEVVVKETKRDPVKLGRHAPTKTTTGQSGNEEFGFGGEWGLKISSNGKKYWIDKVAFHLRFNTVDSILFRIHIYKVENGLPGESFVNKEIFVTSYKRDKWIEKDLSAEHLIMDQDLIVTFEVVRVWFSKSGDNAIFFTHGEGYEEGRTYSRDVSHGRWEVDARPPVAMYLSVVDY
jgi:hypothetical protein